MQPSGPRRNAVSRRLRAAPRERTGWLQPNQVHRVEKIDEQDVEQSLLGFAMKDYRRLWVLAAEFEERWGDQLIDRAHGSPEAKDLAVNRGRRHGRFALDLREAAARD